jgi:DNA-binding NarL/FixJ family response regulator
LVVPVAVLTPRELEVAHLVTTGLRNHAIAEHLGVSVNTVKHHVLEACQKLGCHGRLQLALWYVNANLVPPK